MSEIAFVSLGSNLGDRDAYLERACRLLEETEGVALLRRSTIHETEPVGPPPQGRYLNAVVELRVSLAPESLLARLLEIERVCDRERGPERWGPRTLDLDLLFYGDRSIEKPGLTVPHPRLHERDFVVEPLCELAPEWVHPVLGDTVEKLAERLRSTA